MQDLQRNVIFIEITMKSVTLYPLAVSNLFIIQLLSPINGGFCQYFGKLTICCPE